MTELNRDTQIEMKKIITVLKVSKVLRLNKETLFNL